MVITLYKEGKVGVSRIQGMLKADAMPCTRQAKLVAILTATLNAPVLFYG